MANVLPPDRQRAVWREYRSRAFIVLAVALLASAALALLSLLPSYLVLSGNDRPVASESSVLQGQADVQWILRTQSLLATVLPILSSTTSPTSAIREVLALRPAGVRVERVSYRGGDRSIVFGGTSDGR